MGLYSLKLNSTRTVILAPHEEVPGSTPTIWDRCRAFCRSFVASQAPLQIAIIALAAAAVLTTLVLLVLDSEAVGSVFGSGPSALPPDGSQGAAVGRVLGFERLELMSRLRWGWAVLWGGNRAEGGSWGRLQGWEERRGRKRRRRRESSEMAEETPLMGSDGSSEEGEGSRVGSLPSFAYCISGYAKGHGSRMARLLSVVYHQRNAYCLHMDAAAKEKEMEVVRGAASRDPLIAATGNVFVVEKRNLVTYRGPTMTTMYLHCAAILLERRQHWDWFINLSAADYPLVTQDDLASAFASVPRHLNFIQHEKLIERMFHRAENIVLDEAITSRNKTLLHTKIRRPLPSGFQVFKGEAWVVLSQSFVRFLIDGVDTFPRILLLYMANFDISDESFFPTVACNSGFRSTVVNMTAHYIRGHRHSSAINLEVRHLDALKRSNLPFARKFENNVVLDIIDETFLGVARSENSTNSRSCHERNPTSVSCTNGGNSHVNDVENESNRLHSRLKYHLDPNVMKIAQCK